MKFTTKNYKILKTKKYLKKKNLFFFFNGVNRNSNDWILTKQGLKVINFNYYKVFNKTTNQILKSSIYDNFQSIIYGTTFFIQSISNSKPLSINILTNNFEQLLFIMLAIKLNNKIYGTTQIKNSSSLEYNENMLLFYQFELTHVKSYFNS